MAEPVRKQSPAPPRAQRGTPRRPTLFETYCSGMLHEEKLREISDKLDRINDDPPAQSTHREETFAPSEPSGEPSGVSSDESHGEPRDIPLGQPLGQLVGSPDGSSPGSPDGIPRGQAHGEMIFLTENQALLYECLKYLNGQFVTLPSIARTVNVSVDTLRSCIRKLRKIKLITWSVENFGGHNGMLITTSEAAYRLRGSKVSLHEKLSGIDYTQLGIAEVSPSDFHHVQPHVVHQGDDHMVHQTDKACSSSLKKQQLQTLIREDAFQDLNPQSLLPYRDQFDTIEQLQIFLDMANACIAAAQAGHGKPIKNPQGFLFAQLKAGYINPPAGFKSRKIRAQEIQNQQLEEELATLRQLKEQEQGLQFELFREKLTREQRERLEQEARAQYKPGLGLSEQRQIEIAKGEIVKQWFAQWGQMDAETAT